MKTLCLWSGPRNVSTALMYSFNQRSDTHVVDEPLYGHYLRVTGADHPGRYEVMQAMNCDGNAVMHSLLRSNPSTSGMLFIKHMAHHLLDLDLSFLATTENIFLIRDPAEMLPSLTVQIPHAEISDTGLKRQWDVYRDLLAHGQTPTIIDARELLLDPGGVLKSLCQRLCIDYYDDMLSWPAGPIAEDGVWAKHWYHAVHKSTGFASYVAKNDFPKKLMPLLDECRPYYENLYEHAIRARPAREPRL